jgi:hypothetical protein
MSWLIPLKLKYRTRSTGGKYKSKTSNAGTSKKVAGRSLLPRRRVYLGNTMGSS